ncbi:MAG: FAD-binding oxidoreductase [Chthonomonas sp.]|nr:FAD-binding oxidoreductase [Chthonomonas sp.]
MILRNEMIARHAGYGMVDIADSYTVLVNSEADVRQALFLAAEAERTVCLRGQGRSYGDASIDREQVTLDLTAMNRILEFDAESGVVRLEPGVTIRQLADAALPQGWWPPVVSGTAHVTIGGALAMNIHGKNHFAAGSLAEHALSITVLKADGESVTLTPDHPDWVWMISSAGLLGVITEVTMQLHRVVSGNLEVTCWRSPDWLATLDDFLAPTIDFDYLVGWIDMFDPDGRAVVHGAVYESEPNQASLQHAARAPSGLKAKLVPLMRLLNNRFGVRLTNAAKYMLTKRNPHAFRQSLNDFNFLLDSIPEWRGVYRHGFAQYQVFIPSEHAREILPLIADTCRSARFTPHLAVLKRHRADQVPLSWALDGVSLAMDFPHSARLEEHLAELTRMVIGCGGKFYMAKDRVLNADEFAMSLGQDVIEEFIEVKRRWDPEGRFATQLGRRLGLVEASGYHLGS